MLDTYFLAFTLDEPNTVIERIFEERFGRLPEQIIREKMLALAGPVTEAEQQSDRRRKDGQR